MDATQTKLKNFKPSPDYIENIKNLKQSEIEGVLVLIDITDSTKLKVKRGFPSWIADYKKCHDLIVNAFLREDVTWYKFLGDAYLFFFSNDKEKVPHYITHKSCAEIFDICQKLMADFFDYYEMFRDRPKGKAKNPEFREITCAIDYGKEILNWLNVIDDNKDSLFDPIGPPVDRCFRVSSQAGPGQLLTSRAFYEKLTGESPNHSAKFEKMTLRESLKGFRDEYSVYYSIPDEKQLHHILDDNNVDLVEDSKIMSLKAKIRLFRRQRNGQKPKEG